jgi:hypothetical protein
MLENITMKPFLEMERILSLMHGFYKNDLFHMMGSSRLCREFSDPESSKASWARGEKYTKYNDKTLN